MRKAPVGVAIGMLGAGVAMTIALPPRPRLVWNASASAPLGLYWVLDRHDLRRGAMVIARMPAAYRSLADIRRYVPSTVPLVKRVAAVSGDTVCARGRTVLVNGSVVALRRHFDGQGRTMPWWQGCATLAHGDVFLLMADPASFDGRYFGPTASTDVIGKARFLWAR